MKTSNRNLQATIATEYLNSPTDITASNYLLISEPVETDLDTFEQTINKNLVYQKDCPSVVEIPPKIYG